MVTKLMSNDYTRESVLSETIRLFSDTEFKKLLVDKNGNFADLGFYFVLDELYSFLKTGTIPCLEAYKANVAAASGTPAVTSVDTTKVIKKKAK